MEGHILFVQSGKEGYEAWPANYPGYKVKGSTAEEALVELILNLLKHDATVPICGIEYR